MSFVHSVHHFEAFVNQLTCTRNRTVEGLKGSKIGLALGFGVSAFVALPMPLPQISLAGPLIATLAGGALGGRAAAAVGFVSYLIIDRPSLGAALLAMAIAALVGTGMPMLIEATTGEALQDTKNASAIVVDCDGFSSLDEAYGEGSSEHVFSLLQRALKLEACESDLVVHAQDRELILVIDGKSPMTARSIMARVEKRFAAWLSDAGYECDLTVGVSDANAAHDPLGFIRSRDDGPYLD